MKNNVDFVFCVCVFVCHNDQCYYYYYKESNYVTEKKERYIREILERIGILTQLQYNDNK